MSGRCTWTSANTTRPQTWCARSIRTRRRRRDGSENQVPADRSGHLELIARTGSRSIRGGYGVTAALEVVDLPVPVRNRIAAPTVHSASPIDTELRFSRDHQMDEAQFHWLVGILEGEGTFIRASPSSPGRRELRLGTDADAGAFEVRDLSCARAGPDRVAGRQDVADMRGRETHIRGPANEDTAAQVRDGRGGREHATLRSERRVRAEHEREKDRDSDRECDVRARVRPDDHVWPPLAPHQPHRRLAVVCPDHLTPARWRCWVSRVSAGRGRSLAGWRILRQ